MNPLKWTEKVRAYYYRLALAVIPLLLLLGVLTDDTAAATLNVVAAVLSITTPALAAKNTSRTG